MRRRSRPGSLYTSLIPILLVRGLTEAIARSRARVVLVMNLMTQPGETDDYRAEDHVLALRAHAPAFPFTRDPQSHAGARAPPAALRAGGRPAAASRPGALTALGCGIWSGDLLAAVTRSVTTRTSWPAPILEVAGRPWRE